MERKGSFKTSACQHPSADYEASESYDWAEVLEGSSGAVVPASAFPSAELAEAVGPVEAGLLVLAPSSRKAQRFWLARVLRLAGYRAHLRYVGLSEKDGADFWAGLLSPDLRPLGQMADVELRPPKSLRLKKERLKAAESVWEDRLLKALSDSTTLPDAWPRLVAKHLDPALHGFRVGMRLEYLDRQKGNVVRVGRVDSVRGPRIRVAPVSEEDRTEDEYWVDVRSPTIFPVGWALGCGAVLKADKPYRRLCERFLDEGSKALEAEDATEDLFHYAPLAEKLSGEGWEPDMRFELLDMFLNKEFCVASVKRVLSNGWLEVRVDDEGEEDLLLYHPRSPFLFPAGFCGRHKAPLTPPSEAHLASLGLRGPFSWEWYVGKAGGRLAPAALFDAEDGETYNSSAFKEGSLLEAFEVQQGGWELNVGRVARRLGPRLLFLHFPRTVKGYAVWEEFKAFHDFRSTELRPCGWGEAVGYDLHVPGEGHQD